MTKQEFKRSTVVIETPVSILHQFSIGSGVPIFVVPPHAGRHGNISQNLIDALVLAGYPTYAYELLPATQSTKDTSIADLIEILDRCVETILHLTQTKRVLIVGLCQGAWLSALYTAKYPHKIVGYVNFAGPINTKTGQDNVIEKYMKTPNVLEKSQALVRLNNGIQLGIAQWLAFSMVSPQETYLKRWMDIWWYIANGDSEKIKKWQRDNGWHDYTIDLAGNQFLDCLKNHFFHNKLFDGTWIIDGETYPLSNITCPVHLYAGNDDLITHPQQVFDMADKVSGPSYKTLFPRAGHTKVFTGKKEIATFINDIS